MANVLSVISSICFVLSGVCLIAAIAMYFLLNTKAAYRELKGQPAAGWIKENRKPRNVRKPAEEIPTSKMDTEDEAVTTLDNGEEATEISLMNVYEPGTEVMDEYTEPITHIPDYPQNMEWEEKTDPLTVSDQKQGTLFEITKRKVSIHSDEFLQ